MLKSVKDSAERKLLKSGKEGANGKEYSRKTLEEFSSSTMFSFISLRFSGAEMRDVRINVISVARTGRVHLPLSCFFAMLL